MIVRPNEARAMVKYVVPNVYLDVAISYRDCQIYRESESSLKTLRP
jgi:hypothetical protein